MRNIHRKTPVLEPLFNKVIGLKACNFIEKETPTQVFSCEYCKIFNNSLFIEHLFIMYTFPKFYVMVVIRYLNPVGISLLKVNNGNTRTRCDICSKLTIKTEQCHWRRSDVFIVNFEHISHLALVSLLLTSNIFHTLL